MRFVRNLSIKRKLTLLMVSVSGAALLVAVVAMVANSYATLRSSKARQLMALADVLASNSTAAMSFNQAAAAKELLASLANQPTVEYACLFDNGREVFADYRRDAGARCPDSAPEWVGHHFDRNGHLTVSLPVAEGDEVLGSIYLHATMDDVRAQFYRDVEITAAVIAMSLVVAVLISTRLQRVISKPILALAAAAQRITERGDYTIRVTPRSTDEIGDLYRQFNQMLNRIQAGEEELRSERDHSAGMIQGTPAIVCGILSDGAACFVNLAGESITGYDAKELLGRNWWKLLYPGEQYAQVEQLFRDLDKGEVRDYEMTLTTKDGQKRIIAWSSLQRRNEQGNRIELIGFGSDITERKRATDEREKLIVELETKNAELERFAYTVSHDLKAPLITIKGYAGLLEQDLANGNARAIEDDIAQIEGAADTMNQLLRQVLELSRIGRVIHPAEDVGLEELARETVKLLGQAISDKRVDVLIAPDLPALHGDRIRLVEVLQNLIENAVKYMGDQPQPRIEIGARREGDEVVCYVRDNGLGIDARYHDKVFGLFDQLDRSVEGSGVGLAVVKRIVEVHGGRIWVESPGRGQGSTFCFTIPPAR